MSYSWYDIAQIYNNNALKYKDYSGTNWTTIKIPDENYSYEDIESFMEQSLEKSNHSKPGVELKLVSSIFKVLITLEAMKQVFRLQIKIFDKSKHRHMRWNFISIQEKGITVVE